MTPAAGCPAGRTTPAGPGRRGVLTTAVVAGLGLGGCSLTAGSPSGTAESADLVASGATTAGAAPAEAVQPFRAARQPGIRGRVQPFAAFVAYDLAKGASATDVRRLYLLMVLFHGWLELALIGCMLVRWRAGAGGGVAARAR